MPDIQVLDPSETKVALSGHRFGSSAMLNTLADNLMAVVDTESSVYVGGMTDSQINALRTKMQRRDIRVTVRKVERNGTSGHVMLAKTVQ
jgi:hypothetical protein